MIQLMLCPHPSPLEKPQIGSDCLSAWNIRSLVDQPTWHTTEAEHRFICMLLPEGYVFPRSLSTLTSIQVCTVPHASLLLEIVYQRIASFSTKSQDQKSENMVINFSISHEVNSFSKYLAELCEDQSQIMSLNVFWKMETVFPLCLPHV